MSSKKAVDIENMFRISLTALTIMDVHHSILCDKKWFLKFIIRHGIFTAVFSIMVYNVDLNIKQANFASACQNGIMSIAYCFVSFQYYILHTNKTTIGKVLDMMKADCTKYMPEDETEIVYKYARNGRKICFQWLMIFTITLTFILFQHILVEWYSIIVDDFKLVDLYPLTYPALVEERKENLVVYTLKYLAILYYFFYISVMYLAFVPLGPIFIIHACGQLEIAKRRILTLYVNNSAEEIKAKLHDIVKHLQYIYRFVDCVEGVFRVVYELTMKFSVLALPLALYETLESFHNGDLNVVCISVFFGTIFLSTFFCYYSNILMEKGEDIGLAIYSCGWETRYDHGVRKTLLLILLRTLQPVVIRTVFGQVSLYALADVFQQAYSLFNLMNAAWN